MKVLHMISGGDTGGAKTHVFALLSELIKFIDVKIVCFTDGVFYQEIKDTNIPSLLLLQKSRFDLSVIKTLVKMVENEGYDIIHVHGARANFIAQFLKKKIKTPIITTVHSDYLLEFDSLYKKIVFTGLNCIALGKMDFYIAVSNNFRSMLIKRGFEPDNIFTVYNGMDYEKEISFCSKDEFAKRYNLDQSNIYVGIIGRMDKVKGHDIFLAAAQIAAKENPKLHFLIAGEGPLEEKLRADAQSMGIADRVHFLGFIKDIYSFINFIDINTLTSYSESFPYVLLEGAQMKKCTISSAVGGIVDLISTGENGFLFDVGDINTMAKQLLGCVNDESLRQRMGEALYEKATKSFSSLALAKTHINIYERCLSAYYDPKKYHAVVSGYYGYNNSGDDALLYAIIDNVRQFMPWVRMAVFSSRVKQTRTQYEIDAINRYSIFKLIKAIKEAKLLISGGGSLIQDLTSSKSLYYYLGVIILAKKMGIKVMIYANGIGPIIHKRNMKIVKNVLNKVDLITLREPDSMLELKRLGVDKPEIIVTADPALAITPVPNERADELLKGLGIGEKPFVAIAIRDWEKVAIGFKSIIAQAADYIFEKYGFIPLFMTMQKNKDSKETLRIIDEMKCKAYIFQSDRVDEVIAVIGKAKAVIGMRLHTLVYAAKGGVPAIGLAYDPKIKGFMHYMGQDLMADVETVTKDELFSLIDKVIVNNEALRSQSLLRAKELYEKAISNAMMAVELIKE